MATREVCIWKALGRESIHLYYAQALAYLSSRRHLPSPGKSAIFSTSREKKNRPDVQEKDEGEEK